MRVGGAYRYDTTRPAAPVFTSRPPSNGTARIVSWTFAVPSDATATCTVTREFTVVRRGSACSGRYDLDLGGLPDGTYTLTVRYTDAAGNVSLPTSGTYALAALRPSGPIRVDPPAAPQPQPQPDTTVPGSTVPAPRGAGRTGAGSGVPFAQDSISRPAVPTPPADGDVVRSSDGGPRVPTARPARRSSTAAGAPEPEPSGGNNLLLPDDFTSAPAPEVIRDLAIGTIKRPTLPLALLAIVVLFLLAQNRIDRRDPKLAAAPVEAEPELDFSTIVRRPEGAV